MVSEQALDSHSSPDNDSPVGNNKADASLITTKLCFRWVVGAMVGTAMIGLTSPLFVRSYLPLEVSETRGVWVLSPGKTYRWRSEGYANTKVGEHGLPGKTTISGNGDGFRVALWGDSQAEGVAVADDEKLFAAMQKASNSALDVYPFTRSGEDAADWITQMPRVETHWEIDAHVFLIVELSDLLSANDAPLPPPSNSDVAAGQAALAARVPAFVIQAARNLLTETDGVSPRRLRFSVGPVTQKSASSGSQSKEASANGETTDWNLIAKTIRAASEKPIFLIYAPKTPMILGGVVTDSTTSREEMEFLMMRHAAEAARIHVLDVREELEQSATNGRWPHGFHNGRFGSGHLNAHGYQVIAASVVDQVIRILNDGSDASQGRGR